MSDVYEYCEMIYPVRAFSPNTTHLFYWKLAAEVLYEVTSLQTTISDRIYMWQQLVKISHLCLLFFFRNNFRKPAKKYPKIIYQENDEKFKHQVNHVKYHGKLSFKCTTI